MKKIMLFSFLFLLMLASCKDSSNPAIGSAGGTFSGHLTMFDENGANPISGTITIRQDDKNYLSGEWTIPNTSNGKLTGKFENNSVTINMNPEMVDNNTLLYGRITGNMIKGDWNLIGFAGLMKKGTFIAIED